MQTLNAEVCHGSNKEDHKSRKEAVRVGFLLANPLIAMSLEPGKRLFDLPAVFPAKNGYLSLDIRETSSHLSQWSLQEITQGSTVLGKEPQDSCSKQGQKHSSLIPD